MRITAHCAPGFFESVYEVVLERDLVGRGLRVERQKDPHHLRVPRVPRVPRVK